MDHQSFRTPPRHLRPAPFWGINDDLTPDEAARQFRAFLDAGYSGAFFHTRMGLRTAYLGEAWFAAFQGALAAARAEDGYLWLYDEDCWPSGSAAGEVTVMRDEYRSTALYAELLRPGETSPVQPDSAIMAAYRIEREGCLLHHAEQIAPETLDVAVGERLSFRRVYAVPNFGCWGDRSVVNTLHPEATAHFLRLTHEAFAREAGGDFGGCVPGIFTDEPSVHQLCYAMPTGVAWYDGLPSRYAEWFGRDFWTDVPYWFFDGPGARAIRLRLNRLILRQFHEAYSQPIGDWCEQHGLHFTGHYLFEEDFLCQIRAHHGGIMTHYRAMAMPGIDQIERNNHPHLVSIRQASSAAHQLDRPGVLCEIFGAQGETATFADLKAIGDYNLAHGVTFFCPHHAWHGAWGRRKSDFPPNFNYQQAYFADLPAINNYFTRLMVALTAGDPVAPVLLLHPIEAAGAMHRRGVMGMDGGTLPEETGALEQAFAAFYRILDTILTAGYGCDLGDEGYLADLGDVEDGMLRVGAMRYPVVAVPPAATWRPHTFALLRDFAARGGTLLFIGDPPTELDGVPSDDWLALLARARHISDDPEQLWQSLDAVVPHCFTLRGCDGAPVPHTYINHRRDGTAETLFITNSDDDAVREYVLTWLGDASPSLTRWEPIDGSSARINQGCRTYRFSLPPNGSLLLTAGAEEEALPVYTPITLEGTEVAAAPREWAFTRSEPNVLVLDRMAVTVDDEAWPELSVWKVIGRLNSHFGLTGVERFQPWTLARDDRYTGAGGPVTIRQQFTCAMMPETAALVFDGIVPDALHVNGTPVSLARAGWHWDRAMRAVPVTDALRVGENVVEFHAHYDRMTEMCATSLIGDFAVRLEADGRGTVVPEPVTLTGAPWTEQGYPYYSGAIRYRTTVTGADHSLYLRLADPVAVLVRVAVNDLALSPLMWSPFETALPCRPGDNVIELNVVSSRQNTWYFRRDASGCPMLHPYGLGPVEILAASK